MTSDGRADELKKLYMDLEMPPTPVISQSPRDPAFAQDPYPFYARLHALGGAAIWDDYGHLVVGRFDVVDAALRDRRLGRELRPAPPVADHVRPFYAVDRLSMLEREGAAHARLRRLALGAFVSRRIEGLRPRIAALAEDLAAAEPEDLLAGFCEPIPVIVIAELIGAPASDAPLLRDWSARMVAMYAFGRDRAVEDAAVAATQEFSAYLGDLAEARRKAPRADLISHLLAAEAEGDRLTKEELIATCILLLNAGHEATVHAFGNGLKALLESGLDPAEMLAPEQVDATVEEMLRHDPPLHMFTRQVYEDMELGGVAVKVGDTVGLCLGAAGRDPARFAAPDRFDPLRPDPGHLAFGGGAHFCLGAALARLELRVALPRLFALYPRLRLAAAPVYADRYHFRGLTALPVRWD